PVAGDGRVRLLLSVQNVADVVVGQGEFRVEFDGLPVTGEGLVRLLFLVQSGAEVVVGSGGTRANGYHNREVSNGPGVILAAIQVVSQVEVQPKVGRVGILAGLQDLNGGARQLGYFQSDGQSDQGRRGLCLDVDQLGQSAPLGNQLRRQRLTPRRAQLIA